MSQTPPLLNWALTDKTCPPPIEEVGILDFLSSFKDWNSKNFDSFLPHFLVILIKFDQIPSFCHNFHDFQMYFTKVVWISTLWHNFAVWISRYVLQQTLTSLWGEGIFLSGIAYSASSSILRCELCRTSGMFAQES